MKQYLDLLQAIKEKGTLKPAAREGMPGTISLFGYQFRHSLSEGFPLLTTKKMAWKSIVTELLWFLSGDTNIKFLVDNGCNIWNEDAYNYYLKVMKTHKADEMIVPFDEFIKIVKEENRVFGNGLTGDIHYTYGDCGHQYGKLWRAWEGEKDYLLGHFTDETEVVYKQIDQIAELIKGLKENPMSRRHIITAWNPATLDKMALNACHCLVQFNCRPLNYRERSWILHQRDEYKDNQYLEESELDNLGIPKYYLDCQMYQRSADVFLGVPFNIASYALLTHILAKICNMVAGDFIHTFGDVHIYDNHMDAVNQQLEREPRELPTLYLNPKFTELEDFLGAATFFIKDDYRLENYNPHPAIKAELSTGLKK